MVRLRYLVVAAWIAAAAATTIYLPGLGSGEALELGGLLPEDSPAIDAGERSQRLFDVPLTADTAVVERDPNGFSAETQEAIVRRAVDATTQEGSGDEIRFALPILNTKEIFPGSEEDGTTAVTHLFFPPGREPARQGRARERLRRAQRRRALRGRHGPRPGAARPVRGDRRRAALRRAGNGARDRAGGRADLPLLRRSAPDPGRVRHRVPRRAGDHPVGRRAFRGDDPAGGRAARRRAHARNRHRLRDLLPLGMPARARARRRQVGSRSTLRHRRGTDRRDRGSDRGRRNVRSRRRRAGVLPRLRPGARADGGRGARRLDHVRAGGPRALREDGLLAVPHPRGRDPRRHRPPIAHALGADRLAHIPTGRGARRPPDRSSPPRRSFGSEGNRARAQARKRPAADSEVQQAAVAADRGFAAGVLAPTIVLLEGAGRRAGAGRTRAHGGRNRGRARRRRGDRSTRATGRRTCGRLRLRGRQRRAPRGNS